VPAAQLGLLVLFARFLDALAFLHPNPGWGRTAWRAEGVPLKPWIELSQLEGFRL
jgi:hypothetical protein